MKINVIHCIVSLSKRLGGASSLIDPSLGGGIRFIFLYVVVLFVHRKSVADGGTTGELKALYKRKNPYKVNLWR